MPSEPSRPRPTPEEIATFVTDGVVCLRGALDVDAVGAMAGPVEQALASTAVADLSEMGRALEAAGERVRREGTGDSTTGTFASGVDHWREQPAFADFACRSALPGLVAGLLQTTELWLYEDSVLVKEPGAREHTVWHQDLGYFHVDGEQLATTWCPLDDVTPETGAVRYVVGSHRWPSTYRPNLFVSSMAIPGTAGDAVPDVDALAATGGCEVVTFSTTPGDVVVHHARTLHAAGPNTSCTAATTRDLGAVLRRRCPHPRAPRRAPQGAPSRVDRRRAARRTRPPPGVAPLSGTRVRPVGRTGSTLRA